MDEVILKILKTDLQISASAYDDLLLNMIAMARAAIETEGIQLYDTREDNMLVEMYAAHIYRNRKGYEVGGRKEFERVMPRMLRWQLNNKLMSQKGKGDD